MPTSETDAASRSGTPRKNPAVLLLDTLASVKFAAVVVVLIAAACLAGILLPQGTEAVAIARENPAAAGRIELLAKLGLTRVFHSWWFVGLLCLLAIAVIACSARRLASFKRTVGFVRRRAFGSLLIHSSILLVLAGGVVRCVWGQKGYMELHEGETKACFVDETGAKPLPFAVHLVRFEITTYAEPSQNRSNDEMHAAGVRHEGGLGCLVVEWPEQKLSVSLPVELGSERTITPKSEGSPENAYSVKITRYVPDFVINTETREVTSRSSQPRNPAILVEVTGPNYSGKRWLFSRFPDLDMKGADGRATGSLPLRLVYVSQRAPPTGPIKNFRSTLRIIEGNNVIREQAVEVNSPLSHKGYTFYQAGFDPRDLSFTSLQVVKDPGVPIVYAGFTLLIVGLLIVFCLNPWLQRREARGGVNEQHPTANESLAPNSPFAVCESNRP